jgi:hypothetical protein
MTGERTLFREAGVGWGALLVAPAFAALGFLAELAGGGPTHTVPWILVGFGLLVLTLPWVYARRRFLSVQVTTAGLWQGREAVPIGRVEEVEDVGSPVGAKVLGGGWTVPRKYQEVPIRLDDGTVVLAWARDGEGLRTALRRAREAWEATPRD